jgi:hypothetical protein
MASHTFRMALKAIFPSTELKAAFPQVDYWLEIESVVLSHHNKSPCVKLQKKLPFFFFFFFFFFWGGESV